jgi:CsoR family transcriptional regulator, copper-sensing transcriptional repressor
MSKVKKPEHKKALLDRMARVEGQLRGVRRLVDTEADVDRTSQQLAAARKALDKTFYAMVGYAITEGSAKGDEAAKTLSKFA